MKFLKVAFALALAASFGTAQAFHDGGVARCSGCHTMHNSVTTGTNTTNAAATLGGTIYQGYKYLLKGSTPSDTCLNCHAGTTSGGYRVLDNSGALTPRATTTNMSPGGDFLWVKQAGGQRKGHNINAPYFGIAYDARKTPPGLDAAVWNGDNFSCVSCHDPHGQSRQVEGTGAWSRGGAPIEGSSSYRSFEGVDGGTPGTGLAWGSYRILGSNGWQPRSSASPQITADPPVAVAPNDYNKSETAFAGAGGTGQTVVAYVSGMSEWCVTCHPAMHQVGALGFGNNLRHPSSNTAFLGALATNYNNYVKTGDLSGAGDAYDGFVPFQINGARSAATSYAVDITGNTDLAADANSTVMCLSCHRAHASGFDSMLRFSIADAFVGEWTLEKDIAAMYDRPNHIYGEFQRPLCNKCHVKD